MIRTIFTVYFEIITKKALAGLGWILYIIDNARAVPLARKGDAHKGRVFYYPHLGNCKDRA